MTDDDIPLLSFPDEDELYERRRAREREDRERAIKQLEETSLDLYQRFSELHEETVVRDGAEQAVAEAFLPTATEESVPSGHRAERVRAVVNTVPDALITFSGDGLIQTFNSGAERMFGHRAQDMIGQSFERLLPVALRGGGLQRLGVDLDSPPGSHAGIRESEGLRADGEAFPIEVSAGTVEIDGRRYGATVMRDITERKRFERELHRLNDSLQHQVRETQAALEQLHRTQGQLIQAEKMASLGMLVAGVAHEINTPVGVAVTAASFLKDQIGDLAAAVQQGTLKKSRLLEIAETGLESAQMILVNLQRASDLVQGFKQVAVDQTGTAKRELDVGHYLRELHGDLQAQIQQTRHRLELEVETGIVMTTDPGAFVQILGNLLRNSLVHAYGPEDAGVMCIRLARTPNGILLRYADDGRGIPADDLPRIFDPFFTTRRGQGCHGLGLHIVFNLVSQTLKGSISVDREVLRGVTFNIEFPLAS